MLATLALTLLIGRPATPTMSREMVAQLSIAAQNYGGKPVPVNQLSKATGLYMAPTDDIWVYANAQDPQKDEFLRAWGSNGRALQIPGDDPSASSWSLLKWNLDGFSKDSKILEAQLILTVVPDAGYTAKQTAESPLEARPVPGGFAESNWDYSDAMHYVPTGTESDIFGSVAPATINPEGFKIVIDLLHGPADFKDYFAKAMKKDKNIAIAITSRIDPAVVGREGIYKVYSKDATDPMTRPALRIVLDDSKKKK